GDFMRLLGGVAAWPLAGRAQQGTPRAGLLWVASEGVVKPYEKSMRAGFRHRQPSAQSTRDRKGDRERARETSGASQSATASQPEEPASRRQDGRRSG